MAWFSRTPPRSVLSRRTGTSRLEWSFAGVGALILIGMIGFMVDQGLRRPTGPAVIVIEASGVDPIPGGFALAFTARNVGFSTAASVKISGTLINDGRTVQERGATFDYLPDGSTRTGVFFFDLDPRQFRMELKAEGYADP